MLRSEQQARWEHGRLAAGRPCPCRPAAADRRRQPTAGQAARSAGALALLLALAPGATDGGPCFNQLQMLATHNSYHVAPSEAIK